MIGVPMKCKACGVFGHSFFPRDDKKEAYKVQGHRNVPKTGPKQVEKPVFPAKKVVPKLDPANTFNRFREI